jgi:uncharacterized protein YqeY
VLNGISSALNRGVCMLERLSNDIKEAMKAKEKERLAALRYLKSMLIENKTSTKPQPELDVTISYCKKLKDSLKSFPADSPQHGIVNTELSYLKVYLPKPLSEDEVRTLIQGLISKLDNPNMGMVMKELSPQIKGRFDGKRSTDIVKELLA